MKKSVAALMLLASSIATASQHIQSTGSGSSMNEAKTDAIEKAMMRACRSAIVSDKNFVDRTTVRSEISLYNGCIVKNYKVLNTETSGNYYAITIDAEMASSNIPGRIFNNHPDWFYFNLDQHNERLDQIKVKNSHAYAFIDEVFYDYPFKAFNLQHSNFAVSYEGVNSFINVTFRINWNQNYLKAIAEMLDIVSDGKAGFFNSNPDIFKISLGQNYAFNHYSLYNRITDHLVGNRPVVRMRITSHDERFEYLNFCRPLDVWVRLFDPYNHNLTVFFPNAYLQDTIKMPLPDNVPNDAKIQLDVVPRSFCKEFQ